MLTSDACGRSVIGQGPPDYGIHLPAHIQSFVANLLARGFPVWLIGSQAAERSSQQPIPAVEPLVVFDGNEFINQPQRCKPRGRQAAFSASK